MHFLRVNVTFYDAVSMIHDVFTTANPFPDTTKFSFVGIRNNKTVYSQFAQSHFAHSHFAHIFPFRPFFFRPFQLRPFPISPNIFPCLVPFRLISFSPIFYFAQKPSRSTCPFRPMTILPFSHKALPISPKFHFSNIWPQN